MADFEQTRHQLRQSRNDRAAADDSIAATKERLKRIVAREAELDRAYGPNDARALDERTKLAQVKKDAEAHLLQSNENRKSALSLEAIALKDWVVLSDPQTAIGRLKDMTPILLMPVRLETRFKAGGAAGGPQLWVRVYPDDCWIDTFDETLTETEVADAKAFWVAWWAAGGDEGGQRGAWRALAGAHGSGRAAWIVKQYVPSNADAAPPKAHPQDIVLVVPTETPLASDDETQWVSDFWEAVWRADGDAVKLDNAQNTLSGHVGQERAAEIAKLYQPSNLSEQPPAGFEKEQVEVQVAFPLFPAVDTKQNAWSRAPKMNILPDRFVFIGYDSSPKPTIVLGNAVPSPLVAGPDPSAPEADHIKHDDKGNISMPEEMKWMSDFDRAVEVGMGFRINLTPAQAANGFKRVLVVGLRLNADADAGATELETLLSHHFYSRKGLAVMPQGTPTNNSEAVGAGHSRLDDPDQSFDDLKATLFADAFDWQEKKDGQWLAEYLGIDPAVFAHVHNANAEDQLAARAMHTALWPATLGYWMETMMTPVFSSEAIERTRRFFERYVVAGGAIPAIRIGNQPYGLLPATALSRMAWLRRRIVLPTAGAGFNDQALEILFLADLRDILNALDSDWLDIVPTLSFVGKDGADPHKALLDIVGLHPGSVEWSQRYAESLKTYYNRLALQGLDGVVKALIDAVVRQVARERLTQLGYNGADDPPILEKVFDGSHNLLKGGVVDDKPLSETAGIRAYTAAAPGKNYIEWLLDAAKTSLDAVYHQNGFKDDKPPTALLYLMLRHAVQLGYHEVAVGLFEAAKLFTPEMSLRARADHPFLHIERANVVSESRYQPLYATEKLVTKSDTLRVHEFIAANLFTPSFKVPLERQLVALERLKGQPTARLERAFADHVDCCSYRLDAWLLGLVNYQLALMRGIRESADAKPRRGVYLGAYAWLEELRPENKVLTPVGLKDPELIADFETSGEPPLMRDSTNEGFIHAPSLNHAVAAAVLRNGFLSDASEENRKTLAVNLTSERVRTALGLIEGIRAGQSLGDLLGYQFERGLHDRHNLAEVDRFIYKLRKAFPLRADRIKSTKSEEGVPIEAIEARNVIDGLAFAEHIKIPGQDKYPFGKPELPTPPQIDAAAIDAINAEAERLLSSYDAVADLALSEGVYQAVLGNYDRVASTYDTYARGNFPPEPEVIRTPFNGVGLTHRVALHLEAGLASNFSPVASLAATPRAMGEPALNKWLAGLLPPLDQVGCVVSFRPTGATTSPQEVTLLDLGLQPCDLLAIVGDDPEQLMRELDDRVVAHALVNFGPRPDAGVEIRYMEKLGAPFSLFELTPLLRSLRVLVTKSRPLKATDIALSNEARTGQDAQPSLDSQRATDVRQKLDDLRQDLEAFETQLEGPLSDLPNRRGEILTDADDYARDVTALLERAAEFSIAQAGWGFAYDFKRSTYSAILAQATEIVSRWDDKLDEFDTLILHAAAAVTDEEKFSLLTQAEIAISTTPTSPLPPTPAAYESQLVNVARPSFAALRDQYANLQNTTRTDVSLLLGDVGALPSAAPFDFVEVSFAAHGDELVRFAEDALRVVKVVLAEVNRRLASSADLLLANANAIEPADKVRALEDASKVLLGAEFRVFPEFALASTQGDELENALNESRTGELFRYLTNPPDTNVLPALDFPVDNWLYGVARVRDKMLAWEQTVMYAGAFGVQEPELEAMQLPFKSGVRWLALEFPKEQQLDKEYLLYTAHFAAPFVKTAQQCGMLLDEWTELVPGADADTGITFHFDRPNCEAPQSMLLVTPTDFTGEWRWDDLVDALNETLDFAKRRAVEPKHIDATVYAPFLPATVMATQARQLTIAAELALNNNVISLLKVNN